MKHKRHNLEQIIRKMGKADQLLNQGQGFANVCRAQEVSALNYDRWQQFYDRMKETEAWGYPDSVDRCQGSKGWSVRVLMNCCS